jgi:hypothetical protein
MFDTWSLSLRGLEREVIPEAEFKGGRTNVLGIAVGLPSEIELHSHLRFHFRSSRQYVVLDDPFTVREAKGIVTISSDGQPIPNVIVELRDQVGNVVATTTDSQGRFRFKHLQDGAYKFKTTSYGFSSVMGTIVLNRHADRNRTVSIKMPVGV